MATDLMAQTVEEAAEVQQLLAAMEQELADMKLKFAAVEEEKAALLESEVLDQERMKAARLAAAETLEAEAAEVHLVAKRLKVRHCKRLSPWKFSGRWTLQYCALISGSRKVRQSPSNELII